jgi:hypothetical protein
MRPLATVALVLTAVGCASSAGARLEREGNASLTGVLKLPAAGLGAAGASCAEVRVRVTHASQPELLLGDAMVKQSRGRCLYVVSSLPSDAELVLTVSPGATWRCENGEAPTLTPETVTVRLRDYETATRDFRATCEG